MSTKRLSKTVIEGGRYGRNKWERRYSHMEVRAQQRNYLKEVMVDPDLADELEIDSLQPVSKDFRDKLAPMYRWLDAQEGRPWSEVRAEVFQKFDTRTTAGRHITFDHLLRSVVETESGFNKYGVIVDPSIPKETTGRSFYSIPDYYVDQDGILRGKKERDRRRWRYQRATEQEYKDAEAWLNGRMIAEKEGKLYWFTPMEGIWKASWFQPNKVYDRFSKQSLTYYLLDNGPFNLYSTTLFPFDNNFTGKSHGDHWEPVENPFSFRQRGELSAEEVKHLNSLPWQIRQEILACGQGR